MFGEIPDGYETLSAKEVKVIKEICPVCEDIIDLNKENKYRYICKCGYEWQPCLFGAITLIPLIME